MEKFLAAVIIKVITDDKVQASIEKLLGKIIAERIVPLVPLAVASATKAITEAIPQIATAQIDQVSDRIRNDLNRAIPDFDLGIPALDNLMDFWRPRG